MCTRGVARQEWLLCFEEDADFPLIRCIASQLLIVSCFPIQLLNQGRHGGGEGSGASVWAGTALGFCFKTRWLLIYPQGMSSQQGGRRQPARSRRRELCSQVTRFRSHPNEEKAKHAVCADLLIVFSTGSISVEFKEDGWILNSNPGIIIALIYFSGTKIRDKFVPRLLSGSKVSSNQLCLI